MPVEQTGIAEPLAYSVLAGVAERRVTDVVGQAGSGNDGAEITRFDILEAVPCDDLATDDGTQRATDAAGLQAVRQAGTDVVALGQREDLRLVLHSPEGGSENDAVVILLKRRAFGVARRLAGPWPFG